MKLIKNVIVLLLIISTLFSFVSCKKNKNEPESNTCTVTVKNPLGAPLAGVTVYLHLDNGTDYNICTAPVVTDSNGQVKLTLSGDQSYSVGLSGYPTAYTAKSGYTRAERYALDSDNVNITLGVNENAKPMVYSIGDYISDFTITDIDGVEYNLYDLLEKKRAVVLNFWFCGCGPCRSEFPALNAAYNTYKGSIELLAINDYIAHNEGVSNIQSYRDTNNLDMPMFKTQYGSLASIACFRNDGYPTTVVIDRYGRVSTVHSGAITSEEAWNALFEYYIADDYNGLPYN